MENRVSLQYQVHTAQFEGPLDLLLHLIEKEELDITQFALAQVTDEFLAYVDAMGGHLEIEIVAEFLVVAARLIWIKSQMLLPRPSKSITDGEGDEEDLGDALVQQLRAYRRYKEASQWLRERDEAGLRTYVRVAPPTRPQHVTLDFVGTTLAMLKNAAQAVLYPSDRPRPEEAIQRPRISIVQQIRLIRQRLIHWKQVGFHTLLSRQPTRVEAVVTLQAILELIKQRMVQATQGSLFGEILIDPLVPPEEIPEPTSPSELVPVSPPAHQTASQ